MIVVMDPQCSPKQLEDVVQLLDNMGINNHVITGARRSIVELFNEGSVFDRSRLERAPGVEEVLDRPQAVLSRRPNGPEAPTTTRRVPLLAGREVGGRKVAVIAGPCAVESESALLDVAHAVARAGGAALRGGAFKPRTSPYSFQGHAERGLEMLARAREETGLAIVTEVMSPDQIDLVSRYADVLQVGSRNMHNSLLLKSVGEQSKPVLLKRGWSATLEEFLQAAEYVINAGNENVILCERGIRTHEDYVRNTLALAVVPEVKRISDLPVIVDPSHGTGKAHLVLPMSKAAIACGADGLLIEVHDNPMAAWSDGPQMLDVSQFANLMKDILPLVEVVGRQL